MKKLLFVYALLSIAFLLYLKDFQSREATVNLNETKGLQGQIDEKYVMVTFQAGTDYWKKILKGFEDAGQALNVSVEYRGAAQYDVKEQITVLEQVIARKPSGIALSAIHPDALDVTIYKAIDAGIPVVLFDSDASSLICRSTFCVFEDTRAYPIFCPFPIINSPFQSLSNSIYYTTYILLTKTTPTCLFMRLL